MDEFRKRLMKMLTGGGGGELPAEYQEVEWIKASGNSYIDTNIKPNPEYKITFIPFGTPVNYKTIFSAAEYSSTFFVGFADGVWFSSYSGYQSTNMSSFIEGDVYEYYKGSLINRTKDITLTNVQTGSVSFSKTIHLFARLNRTWFGNGLGLGRFTVDIANSTKMSFVPCYRKADNKPGMYDLYGSICPLTNSPFYINAGAGEFIVGNDVI